MENLALKDWKITGAVGEDSSPRKYSRVSKNGKTAILMDCSGPPIPGHDSNDFVRIAQWLNSIGLKAPEIYEQGKDYLIVEDFGDTSFKKAIQAGEDISKLYDLAASVLKHLHDVIPSEVPGASATGTKSRDLQAESEEDPSTSLRSARDDIFVNNLPDYYQSHVHKGRRRVIDWYAPIIHQQKNPDGWIEEYLKTWDKIEKFLPPCPQGFLHVDFHAENLMWLPQETSLKRCGLLDFQGAMKGPVPYDLANLLEDPRMEIPAALRHKILQGRDDTFKAWYRVLGTQFHCRILGWCINKALEGKPAYLGLIPRVEGYIREALKDPILQPLKSFFSDIKLDFQGVNDLNTRVNKGFIRPDAF